MDPLTSLRHSSATLANCFIHLCRYQPVVARLLHRVNRHMFQAPRPIPRERKPDPPADEARQYVDGLSLLTSLVDMSLIVSLAYFADAPEVVFGAVRRDLFQPRFEAHLAGSKKDNNPAIYAIRNAIFATGCRIKMAPVVGYSKAAEMAMGGSRMLCLSIPSYSTCQPRSLQ